MMICSVMIHSKFRIHEVFGPTCAFVSDFCVGVLGVEGNSPPFDS